MDAEWDGSSAGFADGDLVTVYWVREWMICPRRAALRVAEGYWQGANEAAPPPPARMVSRVAEAVGGAGARVERNLPLFSASLGLTGRAECVVFPADRGAAPVPVLFRPPAVGAALDDDAQLAAQALCLGEMFDRRVELAVVAPLGANGPLREVPVDGQAEARVKGAVRGVRAFVTAPDRRLPRARLLPRCATCALHDPCLPELARIPAAARGGAQ